MGHNVLFFSSQMSPHFQVPMDVARFLNCLYSIEMTISHPRPLLLFNVAPITQSARVSPVSEYLESTCEPTLCWFSSIQMIKDWGQQPCKTDVKAKFWGPRQFSEITWSGKRGSFFQNLSLDHKFPLENSALGSSHHVFFMSGLFEAMSAVSEKRLV